MQLDLSREDLKNLMEMSSLALLVAEVDTDEPAPTFSRWKELHEKIFELARKDTHLASLTSKGEPSFNETYIEKSYFTERLNNFSEHVFWTDLVTRLADKALEDHLGEEQFNALDEEERRKITEPLEKALWQECSTYGLDRLNFIVPPEHA